MNVLVADEHVLVRQGLQVLLKDYWPDASIHCVDNAVDTVRHIYGNNNFHTLFISLHLLGEQGFDILDRILSNNSRCYVALLLLSNKSGNIDLLNKAYNHGIHATISMCSEATGFQELFRSIEKQERYYPGLAINPAVASSLVIRTQENTLTSRQREVLQLLLQGLSNKEIARQLNISHETVKVHVSAVMRYFHARNRTEVAIAAQNFMENEALDSF